MKAQDFAGLRRGLIEALGEFMAPEEAQAESWRWFEEGLGRSKTWLLVHGHDDVPEGIHARLEQWIERRRTGEPWSYILGWTPWRGRRFEATPATLIPRPETELLLEAALDVGRRLNVNRVVDVGAGTGIIGITLALETDWSVTATDLSEAALAVARRNAEALGARIRFCQGHLLDPVEGPLGLVVSNPPYVDLADRPGLQRELDFEPEMALFAPERGLALSSELLREARKRYAPACLLEIGAGQGKELESRALASGWKRVLVHRDGAGHDRVLVAIG